MSKVATTSPPPSEPEDYVVPGGIAWRLHEILRVGSAKPSPRQVVFLSLEPSCRHFGDDWPRIQLKVHGLVVASLRNALGEGDVYFQADSLSFLVSLTPRPPAECERLMDSVVGEISTRLCGQDRGRQTVVWFFLGYQAEQGQAGAPAGMSWLMPSAGDDPTRQSVLDRIVQMADAGAERFDINTLQCRLAPVFACDAMTASAWLCKVEMAGSEHHGYGALPPDGDPSHFAELDALMVEFAAQSLREGLERSRQVHIPVHRLTLSFKKSREAYVKICRFLLAPRRDQVVFDIHGIEDGTPSTRVAEYMQWLRPFGRAIFVTIGMDFSPLSVFTGNGVASIGVDLSGVPAEAAPSRLGKFISRAKAANARCHVHCVDSRAVADLCLRLGVDFMDGGLISDGLG